MSENGDHRGNGALTGAGPGVPARVAAFAHPQPATAGPERIPAPTSVMAAYRVDADGLVRTIADVPVRPLPQPLGSVAPDEVGVRDDVNAPATEKLGQHVEAVAEPVKPRRDLAFDSDASVTAADPAAHRPAEASRGSRARGRLRAAAAGRAEVECVGQQPIYGLLDEPGSIPEPQPNSRWGW